jgi:hypothetical protein
LSKGRSGDLVYFVFDLLHLDGLDLHSLPLTERKAALNKLLGRRRDAGPIRYSDHVQGQGGSFYAHACKLGLEGTISKLAISLAKVRDVVGLYVSLPEHAIVLAVDVKSQIQALDRTQPGLPMKKGGLAP